MIRRIPIVSLLLLALIGVRAASAQGFHAVFSPDGVDVWAVGDSGAIYRSTNSGADYFRTNAGTLPLRAVAAQGLTALMVSDGGVVWRSTLGGGSFASQTLSGAPDLKSLAFPSPGIAYVCGAQGAIWKSTDGGASWSAQVSGTSATLWALRFTDDSNGWAVGDAGTMLRTTNGGASWLPVSVPSPNRLRGVDQNGSAVWIVGERGACMRSTDGGVNWSPVNLKLDARSDVRVVKLVSPDTVWIAGGGGFVRRSYDGGATWTFLQHRMHGAVSGLAVVGPRAYFCSSHNRAVFRSSNGGDSWLMPPLMSMSQTFLQKYSYNGALIRGNTFQLSPTSESTFYCVVGNYVMRSQNEGETWAVIDSFPVGFNKCNAFLVSRKNENQWLAAVGGNSPVADRVLRTTNAGATWDTVLTREMGEYGVPLEMNPNKPDTVFFGGDYSVLYRSTNFGVTWAAVDTDSIFRSPCDIVCVPDSGNIICVGDGITGQTDPPGQYYRSVDDGVSFELMASRVGVSGASEIPSMACSRLRNSMVIGTNWSSGGVQRSQDYGVTWPSVNNAGQAWGVDIARDDPNFAIFGQFSGNGMFGSYDGGATWPMNVATANIGNNYSVFARDREVVMAEQSQGLWKLQTTYNYTPSTQQSLTLLSPIGGESWSGGSVRNITWSYFDVPAVRIDYQKTAEDPWQTVATVPATQGSYAWTVPADITFDARIRVSDAWDDQPSDSSHFGFTIAVPAAEATPSPLEFGPEPKGSATTILVTVGNPGSGTLHVSSVSTTGTGFTEGRGSFTIAAGGSDSIGVTFRPGAALAYSGTLEIASDAYDHPAISIPLSGTGVASLFAEFPDPLDLGSVNPGATIRDTIHIENNGNGTLTISNVTSDHPEFYPARTALSLPPGTSDTVHVYYHPLGAGADTAHITIVASDTTAPHVVTVYGNARANVATEVVPPPTAFGLRQNQPNPFGRSTEIRYALPQTSQVSLEVFNLQGERVATLVRESQPAGWYTVPFGPGAATAEGRRLDLIASGVYFYRLRAGSFTSTRKMLYVR